MDSTEVQKKEQVSTEQVSPSGETTQKTETPIQKAEQVSPTPEEILSQRIAEEVSRAVALETEKARRELQSTKDKAMAEVASAQRRARMSESTLTTVRSHLQTLDPDVAKEMELAEYRAKEQGRLTMEQEETLARQQTEFHQQFQSNLTQFITSLGVDPADKKIDWAGDAPNYLEAQRRVLDSVAKIQKENIQTMQSGLEKRLKDLESKAKQADTEANSVSTAASPGVVAGSDAEFLKKFGSGELLYTKANEERWNKIQQTY